MGLFGMTFRGQKPLPWPLMENGDPVLPALLKTSIYDDMDVKIMINMLTAYGIPTDKRLRRKTRETEIYVPETMLEQAAELLLAEIVPEEDEG